MSGSRENCHEGGQKGAKFGQSRAIRAVYRAFGSDFHRLLVFSSKFPRPLLSLPLRTTLYHILAVSRLLSRTNLMVDIPLLPRLGKVRRLVVNQTSDHKGWGLRTWFFRHPSSLLFHPKQDEFVSTRG